MNERRVWHLHCDRERCGPWAGVAEWLEAVLPELPADLAQKHDLEITTLLPRTRRYLTARHASLHDKASDRERMTFYAADRVQRVVNGLVSLFGAWHERSGGGDWRVVCTGEGGPLTNRFFAELERRTAIRRVSAAAVDEDAYEFEARLPELVYAARREGGNLPVLMRALTLYTRQGIYDEAVAVGLDALAALEAVAPADQRLRWQIVSQLYNSYTNLGQAEAALAVVAATIAKCDDPAVLAKASYCMGLLYSRLLPELDFDLAEQWLMRNRAEIERSDVDAVERLFLTAFHWNALALVRYRQGDKAEAVGLVRRGYDLLTDRLAPGQHLSMRAGLLYNIARTYRGFQDYANAIIYYTKAMEMDPVLTEYYNERGNLYLRLGRYEEALADYLVAVQTSPPYPEVHGNLGVCYLKLGRTEEAVQAFTACLELAPDDLGALLGRAEALGSSDAALRDYDAALRLKPDQPAVLTNRAVLHYEAGREAEALSDLTRAIALDPDNQEIRENLDAVADLFELDCDRRRGGPWAVVCALFEALLPSLPAELVVAHDYELTTVLPSLRSRLVVRHENLGDTAPDQERLRYRSGDWAMRYVHGLVNLVCASKSRPWVLLLRGFDQASSIASAFFRELERRACAVTVVKAGGLPGAFVEPSLDSLADGLARCTRQALYEDALPYGEGALALLNRDCPDDQQRRWSLIKDLCSVYTMLDRAPDALAVLQEAIARTTAP
ncbi:MAG TPA: tetratricopeptide repeat protein, partial [Symbiobacteriaceae bacterium]|nr:tetratricopeptide repeat protein [Symbiobacteriaceae bacterium]